MDGGHPDHFWGLVIQFLVLGGADVHAKGDDDAIMLASKNGHLEVTQFLILHGADVHAMYDKALIFVLRYDHEESMI
jgi:hypothetical protein